jgi:hypothetical protein
MSVKVTTKYHVHDHVEVAIEQQAKDVDEAIAKAKETAQACRKGFSNAEMWLKALKEGKL